MLNSCEITAAVTALANLIANECEEEKLPLISAVLVQLGDTIATILAAKELCE